MHEEDDLPKAYSGTSMGRGGSSVYDRYIEAAEPPQPAIPGYVYKPSTPQPVPVTVFEQRNVLDEAYAELGDQNHGAGKGKG